MQKKFLILICSFFLLHTGFAKAQEPWTLEQCIKYAFDNNIQIKQQMLNVDIEQGNLLQSKLNLFPSLNGNISEAIDFGGLKILDEKFNPLTTSASLNASVTVFKGLQKYNTLKLDKFNLLSTSSEVDRIKNNVALNIASAYLQILYYEELLVTSKRQLELTNLQLDRTSILVKAGSIPEGNLLEIEAQVANDELQVVNTQNQLDIAYLTLTQLLDLKSIEDFRIQKPVLDKFEDKIIDNSLKDIFETAQLTMPQIASANYRVKSSETSLSIAKGGLYPYLTLNGNIGSAGVKFLESGVTTNPLMEQFKDNISKSITLSLSIPIFNGWTVRNNISYAKISLDKSILSLENEKNILFKDIQQAYTDAKAAQKKLKATQKSLIALTEAFRYAEQKFTVGLVTSVEYTTAKNKLSKAETDLLQAKYELIFKSKILEFYKGIPLSL